MLQPPLTKIAIASKITRRFIRMGLGPMLVMETVAQSTSPTRRWAIQLNIYQGYVGGTPTPSAGVIDNVATISQQNISIGNEASITQIANGNTASINQDDESYAGNDAIVRQAGTNGSVDVSQSHISGNNRTNVNQASGNGSQASVNQAIVAFGNQTD